MKQRLIPALAIGGLLAIVVFGVLVFQFGRRHPSPPSLEENPHPEIPGEILYRDRDDCIVRAAASGAKREQVYCGGPSLATGRPGGVTWIDADTIAFLVFSYSDKGQSSRLIEVDLDTKVERDTGRIVNFANEFGVQEPVSVQGERARIDDDGNLVISKGGEQKEVASFDVRQYEVRPILWSPDGDWLMLYYTPPRDYKNSELWIIKRDGSVKGTLAKGVRQPQASWRIEGVGIVPKLE